MTRRPWVWLAVMFCALAIVTAAWVSIDRRPPEWDHANHLERAFKCYRSLAEGRLAGLLGESVFYPPLVPCTAGALYLAFPVVPLTAQAVMLIFLAVALAALFLIGRTFWGNGAGLLAAFFFATAPFVVFSLMNFQLDLPLAAMVALTFAVLLHTEGFRRTRWSAVLGVVLGLGAFTKPTFPVYVAAPLLWAAFAGRGGIGGRRRSALLALALLIAIAIALPWYGPRLIGMPFQVVGRSFKQAADAEQAALFSSTWLLFYPRVFQPQFGLLAGVLCAWGLWAVRKDRGARAFLWLATLPPLVVFSIIQNRNLRYTLPILPAAALAAVAGARALGSWKRLAIPLCVALGALQVSMAAFALPRPPQVALFLVPLVTYSAPSSADWQHDRILDGLARASGGRPARVAVVPNYNFLSVSNLRYEALVRGLPLEMTRAWSGPPLGVDLMVVKTGSQGPSFSAARPEGIMRALGGGDPDLATVFPVIAEHALPDGSQAIIRARRIPPLPDLSPEQLAERLERAQESALADLIRDADGLRVSIDYRPDAILRGEIDRVRVEAKAATVGELQRRDRAPLRVQDFKVEVDHLLVNPYRLVHTGAIELLDASVFRLERAAVSQADLDALLAGQPLGTWLAVQIADGRVDVRLKPFPGSARVGIGPGSPEAPFAIRVEDLRVAGWRVPVFLYDWIVRNFDPTLRLRDLPVPISIAPITIQPGRVEIGSAVASAPPSPRHP